MPASSGIKPKNLGDASPTPYHQSGPARGGQSAAQGCEQPNFFVGTVVEHVLRAFRVQPARTTKLQEISRSHAQQRAFCAGGGDVFEGRADSLEHQALGKHAVLCND